MKQISFKVAKAIKEVGYPQDCYNEYWVKFKNKQEPLIINGDEALDFYENISDETDENYVEDYYAITDYLDVWLWLWRERRLAINVQLLSHPCEGWAFSIEKVNTSSLKPIIYNTQEEAIVAAIEYLVVNDLIQ